MNDILDSIPRTALYIRVSTDEQALHGYSLEAQKESLTAYAKANNLLVVGLYEDNGYTASKLKRPALQRLLLDVEANKIDLIIFTKLDRWFRNVRDYYKIQTILEDKKVNWRTAMENYDTSTANGRLHINIMLSVAQDECDRTSERIKAVFASKVARGEVTSGSHALGFKIENKRLVEDEETSHIVKEAFEFYAKKQNMRQTMLFINEKHGLSIDPRSFKKLLINPLYAGIKGENKEFCTPIIERELFETVELLISKNIKSQPLGIVYIFSGLLICAECGKRLSGFGTKHKENFYSRYHCERYTKMKTCAHKKTVSEKKLEQYLLENIEQEMSKAVAEYDNTLKVVSRKTKSVEKERAKIKKKLDKMKELFMNDLVTLEDYKKEHVEYQALLAETESPTQDPTINVESLKKLLKSDFLSMYELLDKEGKRSFWRSILDKIVIDNDGNIRIFFV